MSKKKWKNHGKPKGKDRASGMKPEKLSIWQQRLLRSDEAWAPEVLKMDHREKLYNGEAGMKPIIEGEKTEQQATHRRNIIFENIESKVSSTIPQPKVTPLRKQDEHLAHIIEHFIRNELDRMPFEKHNDMGERTVPIQGGVLWLTEWDNAKRSHDTTGALTVDLVHPKQLAPQPGIYTGVEDMDWVIIKLPTTKAAVKRKYGVNVQNERESEPEVRSTDGAYNDEDTLTQYIGFQRNENGCIDRYSWVNDVELEDLENYQARRQPVCKKCGRVRPLPGQIVSSAAPAELLGEDPAAQAGEILAGHQMARELARQVMAPEDGERSFLQGFEPTVQQPVRYEGGKCPWCGSNDWEDREMEYEQVIVPVRTAVGKEIPGEHFGLDENGVAAMVPTLIPFYRPDVYPIVLQRSVSIFGRLLGNSDVDVIEDQQNTTNRIEKKIIDRLLKAGTRVSLPESANFRIDSKDFEKWYVKDAAQKNLIDVYEFKGNLQYELSYLSQVYEEARQILGITDSFQGRRDPTATSGKAKEYAAAQAAGRHESQRVMKEAAYAQMFELMFKFQLAYADEPRPVIHKDHRGETVYEEFNRYDFLEKDRNGQYYWNDQFLFSCDTAAPLASNREAMWQETRMNLQSGAFGDPTQLPTLILFWGKMELLHYPGAGETKKYLEEQLKMQQAQQKAAQAAPAVQPGAAALNTVSTAAMAGDIGTM